MDQSNQPTRGISPVMVGSKPGVIARTGSKGGGSAKKKKKSSRRRKDNEIYKATDTSVNGLKQLRSVVFKRDSNIVKTPHTKQNPVTEGQFDNAPEVADLAQLRQYHSSTSPHSMAHPPFGFFSLHPSSLSLHPRSAVHLFYPATPLLLNSAAASNQSQTSSSKTNSQRLGVGLGQPGFAAAAAAAATGGLSHAAAAAAISPFHNPRLVQQQKLSGLSPGTAQHALAQHHPGMSGISTTQQLQAAAAAASGQPTFMEYAAAMKRQQLQLEKFKQHEAHKLQQEVAIKEEQLKALTEKQQAAMRQQINASAMTPAAMMARQAQQARGPGTVAQMQQQAREQIQQKQHKQAAAVMASLGQQTPSQAAAEQAAAQQMLAQRQRAAAVVAAAEERAASPKPSDKAPPMGSAMMALAAVRESSDRAAAAAALLGQYSREESRNKQQQQQVLAAMSGMSGMLKQPQQRTQQSAPHSPKMGSTAPRIDPKMSPMAAAVIAKKELELQHQQQLQPPVLAAATSQGSYDEDEGPRLFVRKQPITSADPSPLTQGMDQLETLPMRPYTAPDTAKQFPVRESEITDCDVLLGRGGMTNHHVGNMHFRTLVSEFRLHYCTAKKGDKGRLSKRLTNFVRHKKGRFLQKDDSDNMWYECGDQRAHGKCAQALREGTAELMRHVTESEGGPVAPEELPGVLSRMQQGRPSSALTEGSSESDGPPMPALNGFAGMVPRGGIMAGASRQPHPAVGAAASQASPRPGYTNGEGKRERSSSPKPKRPRSPKRDKGDGNSQKARKKSKSPVMHSQGIRPTIVDQDVIDESAARAVAASVNRRRAEVSEDQSDASDEELLGSRKRAKIEEEEEEEQDYEYM